MTAAPGVPPSHAAVMGTFFPDSRHVCVGARRVEIKYPQRHGDGRTDRAKERNMVRVPVTPVHAGAKPEPANDAQADNRNDDAPNGNAAVCPVIRARQSLR